MVLNKKFYLLLFLASSVFSFEKGVTLKTKQNEINIRFLEKDGNFTYYQRRSGDLILGKSYKVKEVLKSSKNSQYELIASEYRKKILITLNRSLYTFLSYVQNKEIFVVNFGSSETTKLGEGISPELHLKDQWASFYVPLKKQILFFDLKTSKERFKIKLTQKKNKYFIPNVQMLSNRKVLYIDQNKNSIQGLILFDRLKKKSKVIYKSDDGTTSLELCRKEDNYYLGEFNLHPSRKNKSKIYRLDGEDGDLSLIYVSKSTDLGKLLCNTRDNNIYFVKKLKNNNTELASLSLKDRKLKILTKLENVTQIINMDGTIILPIEGKNYLPSTKGVKIK